MITLSKEQGEAVAKNYINTAIKKTLEKSLNNTISTETNEIHKLFSQINKNIKAINKMTHFDGFWDDFKDVNMRLGGADENELTDYIDRLTWLPNKVLNKVRSRTKEISKLLIQNDNLITVASRFLARIGIEDLSYIFENDCGYSSNKSTIKNSLTIINREKVESILSTNYLQQTVIDAIHLTSIESESIKEITESLNKQDFLTKNT